MHDFKQAQITSIVDRACKNCLDEALWTRWIKKQYVKEAHLQDIKRRHNDLANWRGILKTRGEIESCANLQ